MVEVITFTIHLALGYQQKKLKNCEMFGGT